jgi:hypothetical protein
MGQNSQIRAYTRKNERALNFSDFSGVGLSPSRTKDVHTRQWHKRIGILALSPQRDHVLLYMVVQYLQNMCIVFEKLETGKVKSRPYRPVMWGT